MFKVKISFVVGSTIDYISENIEEPNRIIHSIENNVPLTLSEEDRTIIIVPRNIILVDITEVQNNER